MGENFREKLYRDLSINIRSFIFCERFVHEAICHDVIYYYINNEPHVPVITVV